MTKRGAAFGIWTVDTREAAMIESVQLRDVTIFDDFEWEELSNVNLVIGENDTGKSNLLKMLYAVTRSVQEYQQSIEKDPWKEHLAKKLQWTFQPPDLELGRIVRQGGGPLGFRCTTRVSESQVAFEFGERTKKQIQTAHITEELDKEVVSLHGLYLPPVEVLSTIPAIASTREQKQYIGFGDTHFDLVKALRQPVSHAEPGYSREYDVAFRLEDLYDGSVHQKRDGEFEYRKNNQRYSMAQTADGVKKIAQVVHLLKAEELTPGSVFFVDEPEATLHPEAILDFIELLVELAKAGVQIFVATHSYVVLKQFELLAREHEQKTPLCVLSPKEEGGIESRFADLSEHIPKNSIVDASVELYERDINLSLRT
jgi:predicted ATPase